MLYTRSYNICCCFRFFYSESLSRYSCHITTIKCLVRTEISVHVNFIFERCQRLDCLEGKNNFKTNNKKINIK